MQNITVVFRNAPFNSARAREALDMALALAAVDHKVTVLFCDDGVYSLLNTNEQPQFSLKHFNRSFKLFPLYDIEQVIVCAASLAVRQLNTADLIIPAEPFNPDAIQALLAQQQHIISA